MTITNIAFK